MRRIIKSTGKVLGLMIWSFLLFGWMVCGEEPKNLLTNPGFEKIRPFTAPKKLQGIIEATERPEGWSIGSGSYPGKLTVIYDVETSHGGSKYVKIENKPGDRKIYVLFAGTGFNRPVQVSPDKKYVIKVWVKGEGSIGIIAYGFTGLNFIHAFVSKRMQVNSPDAWKEYKFEFDTNESKEDVSGLQVAFTVGGTLYLDDAYFAPLPENKKTE